MKIIGHSARYLLNSHGFMEMSVESMRLLLQCDYLRIGEGNIWDAVLKWAEKQSKEKGIVVTVANGHEPPSKRRKLNQK